MIEECGRVCSEYWSGETCGALCCRCKCNGHASECVQSARIHVAPSVVVGLSVTATRASVFGVLVRGDMWRPLLLQIFETRGALCCCRCKCNGHESECVRSTGRHVAPSVVVGVSVTVTPASVCVVLVRGDMWRPLLL